VDEHRILLLSICILNQTCTDLLQVTRDLETNKPSHIEPHQRSRFPVKFFSSTMSANSPQELGTTTAASELSQQQATYLPPSDLALKYAKGIQRHVPAQPHPSFTETKSNPHLIKSIESFYVRPRWLFVRVETEGGVVGWGEGTLEGHTEAVAASLKDIGRR
jgi:hypothetical protein